MRVSLPRGTTRSRLRRDLWASVEARLLYLAERAAQTVGAAVEAGDGEELLETFNSAKTARDQFATLLAQRSGQKTTEG